MGTKYFTVSSSTAYQNSHDVITDDAKETNSSFRVNRSLRTPPVNSCTNCHVTSALSTAVVLRGLQCTTVYDRQLVHITRKPDFSAVNAVLCCRQFCKLSRFRDTLLRALSCHFSASSVSHRVITDAPLQYFCSPFLRMELLRAFRLFAESHAVKIDGHILIWKDYHIGTARCAHSAE